MQRLATWSWLLAAACLAVACGSPGVPSAATASPSPNATAAPPLLVVLDAPFGSAPDTLRLLRLDGTEAAHLALPADAEAIALAGRSVLVAGGTQLLRLDADGRVERLSGLVQTADELVRGLVASPDGHRWLWAAVRQDASGAVHSDLRLAGDRLPATTVVQRTETGAALQPVAWTSGGIVLSDEPLGIGGYVLFRRAFGPASILDAAGRAVRDLLPADCAFSDLAADGSLACIRDGREGPHGEGSVTLRVLHPGGPALDVPLPAEVTQAGAALFRPGGSAVLSLALSPATGSPGEHVETDLVDAVTGTRHRLGPDGVQPVAWLPDGRILAIRLPGVEGGAPGTYLLDPTRGTMQVSTSSNALGVLR